MKHLLLTVAALVLFSSAALAGPPPHHKGHTPAKKATTKQAALICPVTGTKIASIKAAVGHSTYKGKTYYFCCPECKPKFDKNPAKYIKNSAKGIYEKM